MTSSRQPSRRAPTSPSKPETEPPPAADPRDQPARKPTRDAILRVRVRSDTLATLDEEAARDQRTRSDMARILLSEALARRVAQRGTEQHPSKPRRAR